MRKCRIEGQTLEQCGTEEMGGSAAEVKRGRLGKGTENVQSKGRSRM